MVIVLFLVTFVASLSVTIVYDVTKEPIAISKEKKIKDAIAAVVPEFDNNPSDTKVVQSDGKDEIVIYTAKKGDEVSGYAIETYTKKGFGGKISLMVGFRSDGTIYRVETLSRTRQQNRAKQIRLFGSIRRKEPQRFQVVGKERWRRCGCHYSFDHFVAGLLRCHRPGLCSV